MQRQNTPAPVYIPVQKSGSSFGTIVAAMCVGAFITVSLLYMWGGDVSKHQEAVGAVQESSAR